MVVSRENGLKVKEKEKTPGTTPGLQTKPLNQHIRIPTEAGKGITNP